MEEHLSDFSDHDASKPSCECCGHALDKNEKWERDEGDYCYEFEGLCYSCYRDKKGPPKSYCEHCGGELVDGADEEDEAHDGHFHQRCVYELNLEAAG